MLLNVVTSGERMGTTCLPSACSMKVQNSCFIVSKQSCSQRMFWACIYLLYFRYFCLSDKFSFCFQSVIAVHSSDQQTHPFNSDTENASINSKVNILHKLKASIFPCKFYIICI